MKYNTVNLDFEIKKIWAFYKNPNWLHISKPVKSLYIPSDGSECRWYCDSLLQPLNDL